METGDIVIFSSGFGHVAMAFDERFVFHANETSNFHLVAAADKKGHLFEQGGKVFRPPWEKMGEAVTANYKAELQENAKAIGRSAKYGIYRAVRLFLGDSTYGPNAAARLQKYRDRMRAGSAKTVSKITCAEAVILSYQLTFLEHGGPCFIKLDAAHAMPSTLEKWLRANWGDPISG
ncbi:MAG: hypothetical protein V4724_12210 [Pseudomonadota bacterium]